MKKAFEPFGEVSKVELIKNARNGRSKGFGFVTFVEEDAMNKALKDMDKKSVDGRSINVEVAKSKSNGENLCQDRLQIAYLPAGYRKDDVRAMVEKDYGKIVDVEVIGTPTGSLAYATFESIEIATKAMGDLEGTKVGENVISVTLATKRPKRRARRKKEEESKEEDNDETKEQNAEQKEEKKRKKKKRKRKKKASQENDTVEDGCTIWVGNLPKDTKRDAVNAFFTKSGYDVVRSKAGRNKNRGKFYCYVTLASAEIAAKAVSELDGKNFGDDDDAKMSVQAKKSKTKNDKPRVVEFYDNELFVGNLPDDVDEEELSKMFSKFGEVCKSSVRKNNTNRSNRRRKAFGFVTFETAAVAQAALKEMNESEVKGHKLSVEYSKVPADKSKKDDE